MPLFKNHFPFISPVLFGLGILALVVFVRPLSVFPTILSKLTRSVITWVPSGVSGEVALGFSKTVTVTFTSSKNVRRAAVEVSPVLAPFVRVTPAFLERIHKGEDRQVQLTFSATSTAGLGTTNGMLQLRQGKKQNNDDPEDDTEPTDNPKGKVLAQALPITLTVTVVPLPPDPGAAGKTTLQGIDSDGDGVRDDIQRYIALTFPGSEKTRAALTQSTQAVQVELLDANSKEESIRHATEEIYANRCLSYILGTADAEAVFLSLRAQILNTQTRSRAYIVADGQVSGQVFEGTPPDEMKSLCNFDPDAMRN